MDLKIYEEQGMYDITRFECSLYSKNNERFELEALIIIEN